MNDIPAGKFKATIEAAIMEFLYMPSQLRHTKQKESIILRNTIMTKSSVRAFRYLGEVVRSVEAPRGPIMAPKLHPDLMDEYCELLKEIEDITFNEWPLVCGYLTKMLNLSGNIEDYLLLFPDCIHPPINQCNLLSVSGRKFPTEAHAAPYIQEYAPHIQKIRERMATNLLFEA